MTPSDSTAQLRKRVTKAPQKPGVYRWLSEDGTVIYVGKAKNLRSRMKSYVQAKPDKSLGPWKLKLIEQITDFEVTVVSSEMEALVLETNLIKHLRPKFNVMMKDDKNYVYLRITMQDPYPRVQIDRKLSHDGAKEFGPFLSNYDLKRTLEMLQLLFHFRACSESIDVWNRAVESGKPQRTLRPCLDSQIGQCNGLCAGTIDMAEYRNRITAVLAFFRGEYDTVYGQGMALMQRLASEKKFERAGQVRDALGLIDDLRQKQIVSDTSGEDTDAVGIALLSGKVQVVVLRERNGKVLDEHNFPLMGYAESESEVLEQFALQYYEGIVDLPRCIVVPAEFESANALSQVLSQRAGHKVEVRAAERGKKSKLLDLALSNAHEKAKAAQAKWEAEERNVENALGELQEVLKLPALPRRIECYDISHTGGDDTVGSMVVAVNGKPLNAQYRSFTIKSLKAGDVDDFASLAEVLRRRLRYIAGGLKREAEEWEKEGVTVKKDTRRKTQDNAKGSSNLRLESCVFKALHEGEIIASLPITKSGPATIFGALTIDPTYEQSRLGTFLLRTALASVKKGKVYAAIDPSLEQAYASLGFRYIRQVPSALAVPEGQIGLVFESTQNKPDVSLNSRPDLLVIDGGKGQLSTIVSVLKEMQLEIPVIGLAKREEEVFAPSSSFALPLKKHGPAQFLLMRIRDEAHRFANRLRETKAKHRMLGDK